MLQVVLVIEQVEGVVATQEQLKDPESKFCELPLKVSVRLRLETVPPPTFSTVPDIG